MIKKLIKISVIGKTNSGKSTFINSIIGEKISITNKKVNTTQELITGITNINNVQLIFYDTPGTNNLKIDFINKKKIKKNFWEGIENSDYIFYFIDSSKYNYEYILKDFDIIHKLNKKIVIIFNKIDLINKNNLLPYVKQLKKFLFIDSFFYICSKNKKEFKPIITYLYNSAPLKKWIYNNDEITDKDDIFISNECTRNAILKFIHKEIPYNLSINNISYVVLKSGNIKIKQSIELQNLRHKSIILGKNGETIKRIRLYSQKEISKIMNAKIYLYLIINKINA